MFLFFVSSQLGLCKQDPCVADILTKKRVLITGIIMSFQCNSCDNPYTEIYLYFLLGGGGLQGYRSIPCQTVATT